MKSPENPRYPEGNVARPTNNRQQPLPPAPTVSREHYARVIRRGLADARRPAEGKSQTHTSGTPVTVAGLPPPWNAPSEKACQAERRREVNPITLMISRRLWTIIPIWRSRRADRGMRRLQVI